MSNQINPTIENSWKTAMADEFQQPYFKELKVFLKQEKENGQKVFPKGKDIFNAFNSTPFDAVNVVIIGQDPYHSYEIIDDQELPHAHGLSFSIPKEAKKIPPSLKNIYKEIASDIGCEIPNHGNLTSWANDGVLMLNATLTVRAHEAGSHQKKGWEEFTDAVIKCISERKEGVVFLLWGRFAQQKKELIDQTKHHVLEAAHPSPFSARNGFFGCKHFSSCNQLLQSMGKKEINWSTQ